jgi:formate dehydrogenase iron-sulfur subunit
VELWKGVTKYAGLAVMGGFAAFGFLHYLISGPNEVTAEDEKKAEQLTGSDRS